MKFNIKDSIHISYFNFNFNFKKKKNLINLAMSLFGNMKGLAYYTSNEDDPYITLNDEVNKCSFCTSVHHDYKKNEL
jgi:hypothetical protein